MKRTLPILAAVLLGSLALAGPAPAAQAPASFAGMAPQGPTDDRDFALMESSDVSSVRLPMYWSGIQPESPFLAEPDFDGFDHEVRLAAEHEIRIMPFLWGSPDWAAAKSIELPVSSSWQRWGWATFLRDAVDRYGPYGTFWVDHPALPYLPIRSWEIWNEENIVTFSSSTDAASYAKLIRASGRILHESDPGARVLLGGLFGRPLQVPPNTASGAWLAGLYRAGNVKSYLRRRGPASLCRRRRSDAGPDSQPAARDAPQWRRPHAALHDRDRLGLRQLRVALGARSRGSGPGDQRGDVDARGQPPRRGGSAASGGSRGRTSTTPVSSATRPGC